MLNRLKQNLAKMIITDQVFLTLVLICYQRTELEFYLTLCFTLFIGDYGNQAPGIPWFPFANYSEKKRKFDTLENRYEFINSRSLKQIFRNIMNILVCESVVGINYILLVMSVKNRPLQGNLNEIA